MYFATFVNMHFVTLSLFVIDFFIQVWYPNTRKRGDIMNDRLKELRIYLKLTQQEFADKLGTSRNNIAGYEIGRRSPSDAVVSLICKEYRVNETWLRTGEGEMFTPLPDEDEFSIYVEELLADDGSNPLYGIIKEIMHTYKELDPKSQEVICDFSGKLRENLAKEKREG